MNRECAYSRTAISRQNNNERPAVTLFQTPYNIDEIKRGKITDSTQPAMPVIPSGRRSDRFVNAAHLSMTEPEQGNIWIYKTFSGNPISESECRHVDHRVMRIEGLDGNNKAPYSLQRTFLH